MSRTIRRTKTSKPYARIENTYTHLRVKDWLDVEPFPTYRSNGVPKRPPEGKEFKKLWWKFHSDNGLPIFGFENAFERPYYEAEGERRARWKREIIKWMKDEEYEIIITPPKSIWDLY